jgi:twinkle protein
MLAKNETLVQALDDIRGYLGIEKPAFHRQERVFTRPSRPAKMVTPKSGVLTYLTEARNLSQPSIDAYKIGEEDGRNIIFPFLRDGELIMGKRREAVDGAAPKPISTDAEKILFGWQAIPDDQRVIYLTEGEIDAMSMYDYGYPAMSVPFGGGGGNKQDWIENEFDRLDRFEVIYLCLDNDEPGELAVEEIAKRLGRHRCQVVRLPRKDANECLVDGVSQADIDAAIAAAQTMDPEMLRRASDYLDNVIALFHPPDGIEPGYSLPYGVGKGLRFRPAEVTIWSGASGSGKSQILSDCTVHWISRQSRICMASLEMAPAQTLRRMVKQAGNVFDKPSKSHVINTISWLDPGLFIVDRVGKLTVDVLLDVFEYARARYGCDQFVIDSLMRLGLEADDYAGQELIMFQIVDWTIDVDVHVHIVAHSRKSKFGSVPGTEDIKGAMELGANAFNILSVHRRRDIEEEIAKAKTDEERERLESVPGVIVNCSKQRNGDWEGKMYLHFNQSNYQYRDSGGDRHGRSYIGKTEVEQIA